jgi:hypothetical protein
METIVREETFSAPMSPKQLHVDYEAQRWCLDLNRAWARDSYLARDGRRLVCIFTAPDAESVRRATVHADDASRVAVWQATAYEPPAPVTPGNGQFVIVERAFDSPVHFEEIQAREDGGAWCLQLHRVSFVRTYFAIDRRRMICLYVAPDAESVRTAQKRIGMPVTAMWPADLLHPHATEAAPASRR